jgi:hypothetical protein
MRFGHYALVVGVFAESQSVPIFVSFLGVAWGVLCWFAGVRRLVQDPQGEIRRNAEMRGRSRLLHPFGGGDVERAFTWQWRFRWLWPVATVGYVFGVLWMFVLAFWG